MDQTTPQSAPDPTKPAPLPLQARQGLVQGQLQAVVYGALLAVIIGWVLYIGRPVFVPMVFGVIVAYIIIGLSRGLRRLPTVGRWLPAWLCYVASIASILGIITAGAVLVVNNIGRVVQLVPEYEETLLQMIQRGAEFLRIETAPTWRALRDQVLEQISTQAIIGSTVVSATAIVATLAVVLLYVTFLLVEKRVFPQKLRNLSDDPSDGSRVRQVLDNISTRVGQYLALKTLVSVILGVISWAIMEAFGVEFAAFWAVLITVLNFVPYIGSFLGVLLPVAWGIVQFGDWGTVITILVLLTTAQFVIGNFLDPWLMGNSLNLSPFVILASLTIWGGLWGIPGAFLAVPITSVLAIILSEFRGTRPIAILMSRSGQLQARS